jgi:hypothetical protein
MQDTHDRLKFPDDVYANFINHYPKLDQHSADD